MNDANRPQKSAPVQDIFGEEQGTTTVRRRVQPPPDEEGGKPVFFTPRNIAGIAGAIIIIGGIVGILVARRFGAVAPATTANSVAAVNANGTRIPANVNLANLPAGFAVNRPKDVANQDSDRDGLTNLEEYQLGTSIQDPDSDHDGLTDYQEIKIYRTNPLQPDSDGDSYTDGREVATGNNPLGTGKLRQ